MPTLPINALPYPAPSDPNDPPADLQLLGAQLDTRLVPRFANAAARDAVITAPVNGMICWLDDSQRHWSRRAGQWIPLGLGIAAGGSGVLVGAPYTGQPLSLYVFSGTLTTNSAGDTAVPIYTLAQIGSGGVLTGWLHGTAGFQITASFPVYGGALYARLWSGTTVIASTSAAANLGLYVY